MLLPFASICSLLLDEDLIQKVVYRKEKLKHSERSLDNLKSAGKP